ncbi:hypothetical protein NDU88_010074 [Pleurodeles waltl]|uniref:Uncharacterized protein n=1 Tax=Pleurodeles waltl TaxID=8319 RepID=A0AAV7S088_PLEWA|nr:hypothetical protein NDU88_010074 [Pleurodeles waltl]
MECGTQGRRLRVLLWQLHPEVLGDPEYATDMVKAIQGFFPENWNSTQMRGTEWGAFKVVVQKGTSARLYYLAGLLKYAALWCEDGIDWENKLLLSSVAVDELPRVLMSGWALPAVTPFVVTREMVDCQVLCQTLYAKLLQIWWLWPFLHIQELMDVSEWLNGGCQRAGDLFLNGIFMTQEEMETLFGTDKGQVLQYASISCTACDIWTSFPEEARELQVLQVILVPGSPKCIISQLNADQKNDRPTNEAQQRASWVGDLATPLMDNEWARALTQVKEVSSNARFKLTQFYYVHKAYLMSQRLHRI